MPRRESTPVRRASAHKKEIESVRKKYRVTTNRRRRLLPGEEPHVGDMCVILKLGNYSNVQIAKVIGISTKQVKEFLEHPEFATKLIEYRQLLPQAALDLIQGLMIEAVTTIADVMRTSEDEKFILQAAFDLLDRGGLPKSSKQERTSLTEERVTIEDGGLLEKLRQLPPQQQEEAAQMIEKLEELLAMSANGNGEGHEESS